MKYLDLESDSIKEYVLIKILSSSHYPLCSTICDASTLDEDTPFSSSYSYDELSSQLTQGSEVSHNEKENNQIIVYPLYSLSFSILHEDSSSNHLAHEISLIHTSLYFLLEESLDLNNLVIEVLKYNKINDRDGFHLVSSGPIEIISNNYLHTMHDMIQSSKFDFSILESTRICQEVEALQLLLMVMSISRDSGKIPELGQI